MRFTIPTFPKLAVILSAFGLAAGFGIAFIIPAQYESGAKLRYQDYWPDDAPPHLSPIDRFETVQGELRSRVSLSTLIQKPELDLYPDEKKTEPIEDIIERMRKSDLRFDLLTPGEKMAIFRISFKYSDASKAQSTVQRVITMFEDEDRRLVSRQAQILPPANDVAALERRVQALERRAGISPEVQIGQPRGRTVKLSVVDAPNLPTSPVYPNRPLVAMSGMGAGFLIAAIVSIFRAKPKSAPVPVVTGS